MQDDDSQYTQPPLPLINSPDKSTATWIIKYPLDR